MAKASAKQTSKRQRTGRYAPGNEARAKIIEIAIEVFGRHGFEQASTRVIAARAEVNLAALQYYFGGKEQLYRACAEHIADQLQPRLDSISLMIESDVRNAERSRKEVEHALRKMLSVAIDNLLNPGSSTSWVLFISRGQMFPGVAFDILYDRVVSRLIAMFSSLVGRVIEQPPKSKATIIRTLALLGPIFTFQRAQGIALRALDWPNIEKDRLALVKTILIQQSLYGLGNEPLRLGEEGSESKK
jgi:TetR/AcrR family transcriptional regulator, regulator of cefoperazone and chloramphenicol sensitivity